MASALLPSVTGHAGHWILIRVERVEDRMQQLRPRVMFEMCA